MSIIYQGLITTHTNINLFLSPSQAFHNTCLSPHLILHHTCYWYINSVTCVTEHFEESLKLKRVIPSKNILVIAMQSNKERQTDRQKNRQTNRETNRQIDTRMYARNMHTHTHCCNTLVYTRLWLTLDNSHNKVHS